MIRFTYQHLLELVDGDHEFIFRLVEEGLIEQRDDVMSVDVDAVLLARTLWRNLRIRAHPITRSGGSDQRPERSDERDDDQAAGLGSGWGLRPFWRRIEEPRSGRIWALCTSRSQMASAIVGSPIASCQLFVGSCEVITVDVLPYRSSSTSSKSRRSMSVIGASKKSSSTRTSILAMRASVAA